MIASIPTTEHAIINDFDFVDMGTDCAGTGFAGGDDVGEVADVPVGGWITAVVFLQVVAVLSFSTEISSLLEVGFACQIVKLFAS